MQVLAALLDTYNLALNFVRLVKPPVKPRYVIFLSMILVPAQTHIEYMFFKQQFFHNSSNGLVV